MAAVLRLRPDMALREEHLAARRVNWRPKAESLEELARELQVGLDAFIFLDDAEVECVAVAAAHPEVLAIALPADPAQLPAFLEHVWAFDRARTTAEDRDRTGMVRAEQRRREARLVQPSLEEFLAGLELEVSFAPLAAADAPRAAQLTLRTNQFNLSGARRDEVEILALARRPGWLCRVVEVADRFGRYGLVGLLFAERQGEALRIDTLLLSCRVLGRGVEAALLGALREEAAAAGVGRIEAPLKLSPKNGPILDFLRRSGLAEQPGESGWIRFSCPTSALPGVPPHVRCSATRRPPEVAGLAPVAAARPAPEGAPAARDGFAVPAALKRLLLRPEQLLPLEHVSGAALARLRSPAVRPPAGPAFEPPAGEMERALAPVWCEVLGCQRVGRRDDFFWLGGDSLLATALVARIHGTLRREIGLAEVFQHSELAALARRLERGRAGGAPPIPREPARPDGEYPASSAQKRQFVLQRLAPESTGYNNSSLHRLCGPLDLGRLEAALRAAVERHEALRTTFALRGGQLVQLVNDDLPLDWEVERQPVAPGEEQEWAGARIRPFDLGRGPLLRVRLAPARPREPGGEEWLLLLDVHHAVADGASLQILAGELMRGYRGEPVRAPLVQYRDFAAWQERELAGDRGRRAAQHWLGELRGELPVLNLPADFGRRAFPSQLGDSVALDLPDPLRQAVAALALARGATPFMVLLSAYGVLLLKYTGQEDLVVGTPAAARLHDDLRGAVGMYANTLALRVRPDPAGTFGQLLGQVRERLLQGYPWQDYPFERLVERLDFPREPSRNPLFDTMFALQTLGPRRGELAEGIAFEAVELRTRTSKFDCTLDALDGPDGLRLVLEFAADLFRRETMERLLRHYVSLLQQICRDPEVRLAALDPLSPAEREHLVERLNRPRRTPRPGTGEGRTFDEAFEDQARSRPDALALVFRDQELTYGELGRRVNRLAGGLRRLGVGRGTVVGVLLRRSPEVVTAVLAVLRAGGAYLPIDPAHPAERVAWILRHGGAALLLTEPDLAARVPFAGPRVHMGRERFEGEPEAGPPRQHGSSDLAYVIYTSGTTGRPRGVMVEHRQLMNAGYGWKAEYFLDEIPANVLQLASISFDVFTGDLARAFLAGGTLVLCPEEDRLEPHALVGLIRRHEVTLLEATPQLALPLMEHAARGAIDLPSLRLLILGSDAVPIEDYRRLLARFGQQLRIVNSYGVTEAAIDSCYFEAAPGGLPDTVSGKVPIGRPMPGVRLHVLDQNLGLVPPGAVGELYVGGAGVARGYRGDPGQTAQRFLPDPFADGERLYRTGDVARWLESGDVEFLGRADRQVKIRGYRIEPGEIEHQLLEMEGVRRAAVVDFDGGRGERWLCAYLVAEAEITAQEMRAFLVRRLPEYMVPARLVLLEALPLSPNGKVDTRALPRPPAPSGSAPGIPGDAEPEAPLEKRLSALWCEVLGVPAVGRADSFFDMGGNSFSLLHLHGRVQAELAPDLRAADLFSYPTVEALARRIGELEAAARPSARAPLDGELQ